MPLTDRDIFDAACHVNTDHSIETILADYEKGKKLYTDIKRREECGQIPESACEETPRKKWSRRMLKMKPEEAVFEDSIICCICGEHRKSLTVRHLAMHGITPGEYRILCKYPPDFPLMSKQRLAKARENVFRAQQVRMLKKNGQKDD